MYIFYKNNYLAINENLIPGFASQSHLTLHGDSAQFLIDTLAFLRIGRSIDLELPLADEEIMETLRSKFQPVAAAGGMVFSPEGNILLIKRLEVWDLPKGKVEEGEELSTAALREVREETGIEATLGEPFAVTYHIYDKYGPWQIKDTHWFMMQATESQGTPQTAEDISELKWATPTQRRSLLADSYATLQYLNHLMEQAGK